jgi:rhodanese-related sulfurtransferase
MMKKMIMILLALTLALTVFVLAGCGDEESPQPSESEETTTQSQDEDMQMTEDMEDEVIEEEDTAVSAYVDVSPQEAKALIDDNPDLIVIDVSPHYAEGHLPGAVNYYLGDGSLDRAIPTLDPEAEYLVYCHVDSVSMSGAQALIDAGFENVYRLEGNYSAWVAAGYPVEI